MRPDGPKKIVWISEIENKMEEFEVGEDSLRWAIC